MNLRTCLGMVITACLFACAVPSINAGEFIKQEWNWSGVVEDETLQKKVPVVAVLTDRKDFEAIWKAWRGKEPLPTVDFRSQIVVVMTSKEYRKFAMNVEVRDEGEAILTSIVKKDRDEFKGFSYVIGVYSRDKIKRIDGKKLPEGKND